MGRFRFYPKAFNTAAVLCHGFYALDWNDFELCWSHVLEEKGGWSGHSATANRRWRSGDSALGYHWDSMPATIIRHCLLRLDYYPYGVLYSFSQAYAKDRRWSVLDEEYSWCESGSFSISQTCEMSSNVSCFRQNQQKVGEFGIHFCFHEATMGSEKHKTLVCG